MKPESGRRARHPECRFRHRSWSACVALATAATWLSLASCAPSQHEGILVDTRPVKGIQVFDGWIGEHGPYAMFVDTGVDPSVVDEALARRIGLAIDDRSVGEAEGGGDDRGLEVRPATITDLSIAGRPLGSVDALAADLSSFASALEVDLKAILGYSFLKQCVVRFDLRHNRLSISESIGMLPPVDMQVTERVSFPLRFNSGSDPIPVFRMTLGDESFVVSLDTGKSKGLEFFLGTEQRLGIRSKIEALSTSERLGARGERTVETGSLEGLAIGPMRLPRMPVSIGRTSQEGETREGNAGNEVFRDLVVTLDYLGGEIIFER